ncbi:MAG: M48 family metallopeptidase [Chlorobium phaeobacteroides]|uniref:Peptidase M48 Ste24p n=1 Tax=Chlorobium phaeobacteroides (strain BS1) TaxID=331678 RepID=B3EJD4_CHLPB|nr:M48 family metallopeptidase [Chlorobium phaeobacteroides]MBL6956376.1 M48 family metallopeptidase [Chlorobium phaeobacteroides]
MRNLLSQLSFKILRADAIALFVCALFLTSCATVPVTGRSQLNLLPSSSMHSLSNEQYREFLKTNKRSTNSSESARVLRVGRKLQTAVQAYFRQRGLSSELSDYSWEFNLIEDDSPNAWCMPGGKIVVYTGILPFSKNDAGLAVVMAHEIAHAVAKHGNERMSQMLLTQMGGMALSSALQSSPKKTRQLWATAFGVGSQLAVALPYSRLQEYEADRIGLIFMAMAGYNPNEAIGFWERMSAASPGGKPPEFLSTHPSDASRIRQIKNAIPDAMKYYGN